MSKYSNNSGNSSGNEDWNWLNDAELSHTPDRRAVVSVLCAGCWRTYYVQSAPFRAYVRNKYYEEHRQPLDKAALEDVVGFLEAKALHEGAMGTVCHRVGHHEGRIYLDLANDRGEVVEIDTGGRQIIQRGPVKFIRAPGMLPIPNPISDGQGWSRLRSLVNVRDEDDYRLIVGVVLSYLSGTGPFPILLLRYSPGSGSTTLSRIVRELVDPNHAPLRGIPQNERDLLIAASNSWLVGLDNVPYLPQWLSSALCRLATGAGLGTRRNYSDDEEVLFQARRPVILNGFKGVASEELLDRAIVLTLPRIDAHQRRTEREFWTEFERDRPAILGCLLDALSGALSLGPFYRPEQLPRMADFAALIAAAEPFLPWDVGQFEAAYAANHDHAHQRNLFVSPVGRSVIRMSSHQCSWSGTADQLLASLSALATPSELQAQGWPQSPRALSEILRRIVPSLKAMGVVVSFRRENGGKRRRLIELQHGEVEE